MNLFGSGIGWGSSVSDPFLKKAGEEMRCRTKVLSVGSAQFALLVRDVPT